MMYGLIMAMTVTTGGPGDLPGKICDELLICKICYGRFTTKKLPKLLSCSHTFCEPCVVKYHTAATEGSVNDISGNNGHSGVQSQDFPCPLCRKCTLLPEGGVEKLANNFTILSLMEILDRQHHGPLIVPRSASQTSASSRRSLLSNKRDPADSHSSTPEGSVRDLSAFFASCVAEKCVVCDKKYPESELACGHCICIKCCYEAVQMEQLSHCGAVACPKCSSQPATDTIHDNSQTTTSLCGDTADCERQCHDGVMDSYGHGDRPDEVGGQEEQNVCHNGVQVEPECKIEEDSILGTADEKHHCEPLDQEDKAHDQTVAQDGAGDDKDSQTKSPSSRPPPYNPRYTTTYVDNPLYGNMGEVKLQQNVISMRETVLRQQGLQHSPKHSIQSSPKHMCHPVSDTYLYHTVHSCHTYDSPYYFQEDITSYYGHPYESPYALRRTQSLRRPPIPPRRNNSSPGLFTRLRKRSVSCPAHPSAPGDNSRRDSNYQSPASMYGVSPPVPPRRHFESPTSSPVRCVKKFGKYSEVRMQTSTFRMPTKVAVSDQGDIVVVDTQQMTIQVFTWAGDYLSMFKVIGVQGAAFFCTEKLAIATHRGVEIYTISGEKLQDLSPGLVVNTAPFKFGFVACTPKSVLIYRQSLTLVKEITKRKMTKPYLFRKNSTFENLKDVAITTNKHIVLLDSAKGVINIIDEDAVSRLTINPSLESCGKLNDPESISVDRSNNVYVADTGNQRVLKFSNNGAYSKCIVNCKASASDKKLYPYGVAATEQGNLIVVISGDQTAEVRIYQLS